MKPLRSLTRRITQRRRESPSAPSQDFRQTLQTVAGQIRHFSQLAQTHLKPNQLLSLALRPNHLRRRRSNRHRQPPVLLLTAVVTLTSTIGYRFYNEPQLGVGTIAPQTLRAPASAKVVDTKTTDANRKAARTAAVPVLMIDQTTNQEIYQALQRLIAEGSELRQQAGAFPFVDTAVLSTSTQQYLRQSPEGEWRSAIAAAEGLNSAMPPAMSRDANPPSSSFQLAVLELQNYRRTTSRDDLIALREVVLKARQRYATAVNSLSTAVPDAPSNFYDARLFNLTDPEWEATRNTIRTTLERILTQGVAPGTPNSLLQNAIKLQLRPDLSTDATALATQILLSIIKPNLIPDPERTKALAEQAAQAVQEVTVEIRRGETIVEAGQSITQTDFVLLDHFGLSRRRLNWIGLLGFCSLVSGAVGIFLLVEHRFHPGLRRRDHILVLLLTLSAPIIIALEVPATNLPVIGLLVGSFYGSALGVTTVGLLSVVLPIGMEISWTNLIASTIGGLVGGFMAGRLRTREELALLGGIVGVSQGAAYLLVSLILSTATTPVWYIVLTAAALQSLMGIAWSVFALGVSPYLEHLFDLITPVRLAELSNPNRPMLKRLASETPGTFQHTLFVATLAEAAARELGCNVELVRAGALYHDIGKMHDPLGFIENQMGAPNKHDAINDPWISAALIKKHVTEGLVMARKCRLPKAIQAFIPEHQGTMSIAYFLHQAKQRAVEDPAITVQESDFCYAGPIPQTRETGIVMLADSCEAALRSLKEASSEEALAMINRILRARWQDNQLVDSGLSRADLSQIAKIFVQVWQQFNHQRIPYPKAPAPSIGLRES